MALSVHRHDIQFGPEDLATQAKRDREEFTTKYGVKKLVYYEVHDNPEGAITREKQIKKWRRAWKLDLIESRNPGWKDLYKFIAF